jgi:dihydropteroate synthase
MIADGRLAAGKSFRVGDRTYVRTGRPFLMGILNVTPDSFSDGGQFLDIERALEQAQRMAEEGADFIDVGGESSRPGAEPVPEEEEARRIIPVIEKLAGELDIPFSVDTTKAAVAKKALDAGARIVNDISALRWDQEMASVVADHRATLILMHMKGNPRTMQEKPYYDDLMSEVHSFLAERVKIARHAGVEKDRILVDPGIGFGKRVEDNLELLGRLGEFSDLAPVLVGPSRKSFIGKILDLPTGERQFGTAAAVAVATLKGADVIRVHEVRDMLQTVEIASRCVTGTEREDTSEQCEPST